jgi:hypothetical protein
VEKLVYLVTRRDGEPIERFRDALLARAAPRILADGALALTANVADLLERVGEKSPFVRGVGRTLSASVSLWLESLDARPPIEAALGEISGAVEGYLVTESVPLCCAERDWKDGERSPGVTLWTAFPKPARLSDEAFFAHWHGSHTPLSFEIHPLWQYVRNSVARPLTAKAQPYRGIVEERFRALEELFDLKHFFGGDLANVKRAMDDLAAFTDMDTMNTAPMSEWIVRSEPWLRPSGR